MVEWIVQSLVLATIHWALGLLVVSVCYSIFQVCSGLRLPPAFDTRPIVWAFAVFSLVLSFSWTARSAAPEFGTRITGYPSVVSGNKLMINGAKVQIWGIETIPPIYPVGKRSMQALKHIVKGRRVECMFSGKSDHDWPMARCLANGVDIGLKMAMDGWATNHDRFTKELQGEEDFARLRCIGMFSGEMCGIYQSRYAD